jgi:hypothetical protein
VLARLLRRFSASPACPEQPDIYRGQGDGKDDPWCRHDQVSSSHCVPFPRLPVRVMVSAYGGRACVVKLSW